jgi:hypothetical protein
VRPPVAFPDEICLTSSPVSKFPIPTRFDFAGCFITGGNNGLSIAWTLLLAYDAWMVSWLGVRCIQICKLPCITVTVSLYFGHRPIFTDRQGGQNALMTTVFRDGIIYYIYLLCETLLLCLDVVLLTCRVQCSRRSMQLSASQHLVTSPTCSSRKPATSLSVRE